MIKPLKELCIASVVKNNTLFGRSQDKNSLPNDVQQDVFNERYQFCNGVWSDKYENSSVGYTDWENYKL